MSEQDRNAGSGAERVRKESRGPTRFDNWGVCPCSGCLMKRIERVLRRDHHDPGDEDRQ